MELSRLTLGFIAAVAVPMSVPAMRKRVYWTLAFALAYAAYTAFPVLGWLRALVICLLAGAIAVIVSIRRQRSAGTSGGPPTLRAGLTKGAALIRAGVRRGDIVTVLVLLVLAALVGSELYRRGSLTNLIRNDKVALVVSAALIAVFAGNELVLMTISPYLKQLHAQGEDIGTLIPTGLHIGWIERTIVFSFIGAGEPAAATLAVAAKSVIRIPEVHKHAGVYAQYVLVGTLANLLVALLTAIAVRIFVGLPPL